MSSLYLLNLTEQHARWAATRQALIAGNIANANTPGYKALDVEPFEQVLQSTGLQMAATEPGHLLPSGNGLTATPKGGRALTWDTYHSGNDVSLEQELIKSNQINSAYSLNTSIVKTFNRLLISSAKGG